MELTLELPDELGEAITTQARMKGLELNDYILQRIFGDSQNSEEGKTFDPPWMRYFGVLKDEPEEAARIMAIIEQECERVDPEAWK